MGNRILRRREAKLIVTVVVELPLFIGGSASPDDSAARGASVGGSVGKARHHEKKKPRRLRHIALETIFFSFFRSSSARTGQQRVTCHISQVTAQHHMPPAQNTHSLNTLLFPRWFGIPPAVKKSGARYQTRGAQPALCRSLSNISGVL